MRKKQDPISLPKRIVLGASLILASTYTVAWAGTDCSNAFTLS